MSEKTENIVYSPLAALFHLLAWLPYSALYVIADVIYFLVYHVVGYRKRIVRKNLTESFPDKSASEIKKIEREFYRHFADYFVETIKLLHVSSEQMRKRLEFVNTELIDDAVDQGKSVIMYASHYCNWEYETSVTLWCRHKPNDEAIYGQVYRPLKNRWFDRFFLHLRGRFDSVCYAKNSVFRDMIRARSKGVPMVVGFISDQHPNYNDQGHVIRFLNHDTAMITGAEVICRKLNCVALNFDVEKLSRGHYRCTIRKICDDLNAMPMGEITNEYARQLEARINAAPAYWLWTHNRWKNKVTLKTDSENEGKQ